MGFPYLPLDPDTSQIRALTIEPSNAHNSQIHCSLETISISDEKGHYEALSYVWGASTETTTIEIDGFPFPVTRNLRTALRYLRKPSEPRTLWIDAICINQGDVHERNVQVRRMGQIYSQAAGVLIWLGDRDPEVEDAMSKLQDPDALKDKRYDNFPDDMAAGLKSMLEKPWWHRVWTIQELILADSDPLVGCGHVWLEWDKLYLAVLDYTTTMIDGKEGMILDQNSSWTTSSFDINRHILLRKQWKEGETLPRKRATVSEIVERTRGYQCTDKRDQVYGVRDLICKEEKLFYPSPDYDKSVDTVYQEAMVALFKSKGNLTFLIHAVQSGEDREVTLPSWVADFSQRHWDMGSYSNINSMDSSEGEKHLSPTLFSHDPTTRSLTVRGKFLGNIVISRPLLPAATWSQRDIIMAATTFQDEIRLLPREEAGKLWAFTQFVKEVLRMSAIAFKIWDGRFGKQKAQERLAEGEVWRLAFGGHLLFTIVDAACARAGVEQVIGEDRPYEYWNIESFVRESCPWYTDTLRKMDLYRPGHELPDSDRLRRGLWETLLVVMQMNHGAWWSATDSGYIVRASWEVREHDRLCEITGCQQAMIVRPRGDDDDDDAFELVCLAQTDEFYEDHYRAFRDEAPEEELVLK